MASTQCPIAQREVAGVAGIQRGHRVEFGMAAARCIRPDAPDARHPIRLLIQRRREMRRMCAVDHVIGGIRSEEHTSELQSLMRISYAVFCLKKKNNHSTQRKTSYYSSTDSKMDRLP